MLIVLLAIAISSDKLNPLPFIACVKFTAPQNDETKIVLPLPLKLYDETDVLMSCVALKPSPDMTKLKFEIFVSVELANAFITDEPVGPESVMPYPVLFEIDILKNVFLDELSITIAPSDESYIVDVPIHASVV